MLLRYAPKMSFAKVPFKYLKLRSHDALQVCPQDAKYGVNMS